ncbi:MAG: alpha/beta hydrolase [Acidiferrobacteraceae bacterium]|nr:alpha/beta hydrolase [Acidiferrobacteraceae bacterium]|tara:strand:- start:508 stop:1296 length:789 start_codon:yes stop_codon:yes gene_type:complete
MYLEANNKKIFAYTGARPHEIGLQSVVFIHGTGMDHTVWLLPSRFFAHHNFNVLATDLPGHGNSMGPAPPSIEHMADEVVAAMDAAGISSSAIVGHSMGSLIALSLAARYPTRARSLALIGTSVPMAVHKSLLSSASKGEPAAIDMLTYWGYSKAAHLGGNENPGIWMLGNTMKLLNRAKSGVIHIDLEACNNYKNGLKHAEKIQCPTLMILGKRDIMTPAKIGSELSEIIKNSRTVFLEGAGHSLMMERPNDVLDELIRIV